ncbi:Guanylate-binding protein 1 [Hondaea fermentalgiana]|uniref:Guanylate-binding protein 1 n=1 Tax=Hondaea fermentalgiana TaxID=2315210 RepID=A0A2R5G4Z4_9STRA|nr:Guanylate-binding protein 1 [Hondaea fermentalgiana]|eukprot:GBG26097.1 Guanylate-binding protein 1 [Hondaea fermentalgiana]
MAYNRRAVVQLVREAEGAGAGGEPGKRLEACEEGLAELAKLRGRQVRCLCVAGMYRSGKSFLLNKVLETLQREAAETSGKEDLIQAIQGGNDDDDEELNGHVVEEQKDVSGFQVGSTTESCTRGIWMCVAGDWIILDSEGLASLDQDETHDTKIFCLGLLLSSYFLYNSTGVIDESALDRLYMVGKLAQRISKSNKIGFSLCWVLRDFALSLEKYDNDPNAYFEDALQEKGRRPGQDAQRAELRRIFRNRQCRTLVRPVSDELDLQRLAGLPRDRLRPAFAQQLDDLVELVREKTKPKSMGGQPVDGPVLGKFLSACLTSLNEGAVPDIKKTFEYVAEQTYAETLEEAEALYRDTVQAQADSVATWLDFVRLHEAARSEALQLFLNPGALDTAAKTVYMDKLRARAAELMQDTWRRIAMGSEARSKEFCAANLDAKAALDADTIATSTKHNPALGPEQDRIFKEHLAGPVVAQTLLPEVTKLEASVSTLRDALADAKAIIDEMRTAHAETKKELSESLERVERERTRVDEAHAKTERVETQAREDRERASETIENLSQERARLAEALQQAEREMTERQRLLDDAQRALEEERALSKELRARAVAAEEAGKTYRADADERIKDLEENNEILRDDIDKIITAAELEKEEADENRERFEAAHTRAQVEQTVRELVHEVETSQLSRQLQRLRDEREAISTQLQDFHLRVSTLPEIFQEHLFV